MVIAQPSVVVVDPHACTDQSDALTVLRAVFDTLVRRGSKGDWRPAAAVRWDVSDDALTYTFELRHDLVFHDGTLLDADAVSFSLQRMARPDMGATLGAGGVYAQYLQGMEIDCPSRFQVRVRLAAPLADFFDILAYGHLVSPTAIAKAGDNVAGRLIGSGRYQITAINPGVSIKAIAISHPLATPNQPQSVEWLAVADDAGRRDLIERGAVQFATRLGSAPVESGATLSGLVTHDQLDPMAVVFLFNCISGPMRDPRVRLALNLAIDRHALIANVLGGQGDPLHGFVSSAHFGAPAVLDAARALPFDPRNARRLLAEAGFADGLTLNVDRPSRLPDEAAVLTDAVAVQLQNVGVRLKVRIETDRVRYANRVRLKDIQDLALFDSSPLSTFRVAVEKIDSRARGSWWQGYSNTQVEALLDCARATPDDLARAGLYGQIFALLQADPPWLYLYTHRRLHAAAAGAAGLSVALDDVIVFGP
jgi:peptide/nickel transport system substrate-binding protein